MTSDKPTLATPDAPSPDVPVPLRSEATWERWVSDYVTMLVVLVFMALVFGMGSGRFLTVSNFSIMANQAPSLIVIAVGMTLVLIVGGIDLSVGSVMALSGVVTGIALAQWQWPLPAAAGLGVSVGLACGLVNGAVTVIWNIPPFIVTLGMLEIARGLAYLVTQSKTMYIGAGVEGLGAPLPWAGLSLAFFLAVAVIVVGQTLLSRTVFGRYVVAVGSNEQAARLSGVDPRPIKLAVFGLSGLLAGVGGLFHCSRLASADPNAGVGLELSAIAAVVIGGASLMGGRGSVVNSFFGVLIIVMLQYGLAQMGASEPVKRLITGLVIVAAVIADSYRHRSRARAAI